MNAAIDLAFGCLGHDTLAADHAYALYGAVSRILPEFHGENGYGLHPIRGRQVGNRRMTLTPASRLTLRLPADRIGEALPLAGKSLRIGDATVQIGVPEVRPLIPAPALRSRLVTIKIKDVKDLSDPEEFHAAVRRQLNGERLAVSEAATITVVKKRTLRIKDREIVGFETLIERLTAEESLRLQEVGVGGKAPSWLRGVRGDSRGSDAELERGGYVTDTLLAKSQSNPPVTIERHCRDTVEAAQAIYAEILADLAIALDESLDSIDHSLRSQFFVAALLHDLGKANCVFQDMIRRRSDKRQPVRHEMISAIMLTSSDFYSDWSAKMFPKSELWPIIWAVAGHHLRGSIERCDRSGPLPKIVTVFSDNEQVLALLQEAATFANNAGVLPTPIPQRRLATDGDDPDGFDIHYLEPFLKASRAAWKLFRDDADAKRHIGILKALVISADVAGSALVGSEESSRIWIRRALLSRPTKEDLRKVWLSALNGRNARPFQDAVAASKTRATLVIAGCGNGKTTAAWMWAERWAGRKPIFSYPTTGTASPGFEEYLLGQPHLKAALIHGRSEVDLQAMRGTPDEEPSETEQKFRSLEAWGQQAIVCTADTVLGLIQNHRRPLFSFPALVTGAFIFDEIHSYDRRLFGALLIFLRTFPGLPVLLMTASLPPNRLDALRAVLGERLGPAIGGDQELEAIERYRLWSRPSAAECWADVGAALEKGRKVLWVCNTVRAAVETARAAREAMLVCEPIIYHSRFRYRDRVDRQREVLKEFAYADENKTIRVKVGASLVIATQVCEMSLDISADLLVTAECPLPALVQRLGRLNRYTTADDSRPCLIYSFEGLPYDSHEPDLRVELRSQMEATRRFVRDWQGRPCRQQDLADGLAAMQTGETVFTASAWLDDWSAAQGLLRSGDGLTVVRAEDLPQIESELGREQSKTWTSQSLVPWTIPMVCDRRFRFERRVGPYPLAPMGVVAYDTENREGAEWAWNQMN